MQSLHEARELLVAQVTEQVATVSRKIFKARVYPSIQAAAAKKRHQHAADEKQYIGGRGRSSRADENRYIERARRDLVPAAPKVAK